MEVQPMKNVLRAILFFALTLVAIAAMPALGAGQGEAHHSEQVVFSGTGTGTFDGTDTPFGFWVWCEAESDNPYAGRCNGAMYFYALGITRSVKGTNSEVGEDSDVYTMVVSSTDGAVACSLTNPNGPSNHGPSNEVDVVCGSPSGTGTSTTAVVNITHPPD
jgi:hypothetical protein